jgi:hypothetical protein
MKDEARYKEIDLMFETYLSAKRDSLKIRVKDTSKEKIYESNEMNYSKVFFDSELNIYKIDEEGKLVKIEKENFEAVVMRRE